MIEITIIKRSGIKKNDSEKEQEDEETTIETSSSTELNCRYIMYINASFTAISFQLYVPFLS